MSRRRLEMYVSHARLSVCVTVRGRITLHGPGCNLRNGKGCPLGGFAMGARVSLLWQHSAEREMSASACMCTRFMSGCSCEHAQKCKLPVQSRRCEQTLNRSQRTELTTLIYKFITKFYKKKQKEERCVRSVGLKRWRDVVVRHRSCSRRCGQL